MRILLVEDEMSLANFMVRYLKQEGYAVDHVVDGKEAVQKILKTPYDVVVLDLMLPSMRGDEVLKAVRAKGCATPVVVLTAIHETESKIQLLNAGADDYLAKPFSYAELNIRIKAVLRRSQKEGAKEERLVVKDLVLIPEKQLVTRAGKPIKLRLKEFALLEYLMRHVNKVVSRSALVESVWDFNAELFSNSVDSHISLIRKKIDKGSKENLIETVHGVGYIIKDGVPAHGK
jgi:two-component system, OmpR family, response regulator